MQSIQIRTDTDLARQDVERLIQFAPQLVLVFGSKTCFARSEIPKFLAEALPESEIAGCSTSGQISAHGVTDDDCVITAIRFDSTLVRTAEAAIASMDECFQAGKSIGQHLASPDLQCAYVLSKGLLVNGSAIIDGITSVLGKTTLVLGGLAGDGVDFQSTKILHNGRFREDMAVGIGFYGKDLKIGYAADGGWNSFGLTRKVTRSRDNILLELDGEPALNVYKRYLGEYVRDLPGSALLFPLELLTESQAAIGLTRTILAVDGKTGSLILAGDVEQRGFVRLMHGSTDTLIEGAERAADAAMERLQVVPEFALLVSCVGRKAVMGYGVDEEIEAVVSRLHMQGHVGGFYSYGEICPVTGLEGSKLHNQTMTIALFSEH